MVIDDDDDDDGGGGGGDDDADNVDDDNGDDDDDDDDGDDGDDKGGGGDDSPSLRTSKLAKPTDRTPSGTILRHGQEIKNKSSSSSLEHIVWHCKQVFRCASIS